MDLSPPPLRAPKASRGVADGPIAYVIGIMINLLYLVMMRVLGIQWFLNLMRMFTLMNMIQVSINNTTSMGLIIKIMNHCKGSIS